VKEARQLEISRSKLTKKHALSSDGGAGWDGRWGDI
jgi:hypothetical protein